MVGSVIKYQQYTEYKNSGVEWLEEVPQHWALVPCRAVVDHIVEKNSNNALDNYLSLMANIGVIRYEDKGDIGNKKPDDLSKCKIVRRGQLVINSMNYAIGSYGMSPYDGICSPVYIVLQTKKDIFLERFALRIFENTPFQKYLATFGNGILEHRAAINWEDIKNKYVPLPTLDEQKNILDFLDHETSKIDSLIEKQQQLIELLKEKRQAVISHAVTKGLNPDVAMKDSGVEWLGEVPEHWGATKIKYVAELTPKKSELSNSDSRLCTFIPMEKLKLGSLVKDEEKQISEVIGGYTYFKDGDLLLAKVTPCFENKNMVVANDLKNGIGFGSSEIYVLRTNSKVNTQFLYYRLQEDQFIELATGAMTGAGGLKRVPSEFLNNFEFALPPLSEQITIKEYLDQYLIKNECLMNKAQSAIQLMKERRTALISAAVTGKIDVRNWQNPNNNNEAKMEFSA